MASRPRSWADRTIDQEILGGGGNDIIDLLLNAPVVDTMTVTRIILDIEFGPSAGSTANYVQLATIGVGVASREAVALGVTALPNPTLDIDYPPRGWLYVATRRASQTFSSGFARDNARFVADVTGMRKIDKGSLFMWMEVNLADGTASTMHVVGRTRALCLM